MLCQAECKCQKLLSVQDYHVLHHLLRLDMSQLVLPEWLRCEALQLCLLGVQCTSFGYYAIVALYVCRRRTSQSSRKLENEFPVKNTANGTAMLAKYVFPTVGWLFHVKI